MSHSQHFYLEQTTYTLMSKDEILYNSMPYKGSLFITTCLVNIDESTQTVIELVTTANWL